VVGITQELINIVGINVRLVVLGLIVELQMGKVKRKRDLLR
jgi:hypothetical protein